MTTALEGGEGSASRPGRYLPHGGPVWAVVENLAPNGIRSPDHPAHSQSLYGLRISLRNSEKPLSKKHVVTSDNSTM